MVQYGVMADMERRTGLPSDSIRMNSLLFVCLYIRFIEHIGLGLWQFISFKHSTTNIINQLNYYKTSILNNYQKRTVQYSSF